MTAKRDASGRTSASGDSSLTRRRLIASGVVLATGLTAGCSDDGSGDGDDQGNGPDGTETDDLRDGPVVPRTESTTATEAVTPTDTAPGTTEPTETALDIETGGGAPSGPEQATDTPTSTSTADPTSTRTPTAGPTATRTATAAPTNCGEVTPVFEESVEISGSGEDSEGRTVQHSGRMHGDDQYYEMVQADGRVTELYVVDDTYYSITEQGCIEFDDPPDQQSTVTEDDFREDGFWADKDPVRTEVLDGERMTVYEYTGQTQYYSYEQTVYVSCETRLIRRVEQYVPSEGATAVSNFDNWGGADPVSPPNANCTTI